MRQFLWIVLVFALAGGWPERTTVVADAQDKKEPTKPGKGAQAPPEKDGDGHYAKIEIMGELRDSSVPHSRTERDPDPRFRAWSVSTKKMTCYLDFEGNKDLVKIAALNDGKAVIGGWKRGTFYFSGVQEAERGFRQRKK